MAERGNRSEPAPGEVFAGYRIERRLGRGGMGILYLAVEPGLDRRVALKLIAPEAAEESVFARRFAEESRIAASIEHPNVVPIYAAGEEDGVPYIAMRFVPGADLAARLAAVGRLDPRPAAALIAQVANGLDAIHAAGLVHRDVKPANVLLSGEPGDEHAYITDFGVARNVATESGLTQTGRFVGTLDYVAPEQISGRAVDARVDVYALGCLLHKLLTGQVPFPREGEAARLYAHLNDPPPAPSLLVSETPPGMDAVVARAMAKSPADRYPSAGDLGRAAIAALSGEAVAIPERTVATGAAATVEPETIAPPPAPRGTVESAATAASRTRESGEEEPGPAEPETEAAPTRAEPATEAALSRAEPEATAAATAAGGGQPPSDGKPDRSRLYLVGGALAMIAIVVVAIVLATSGGGEGGATGETTTAREGTIAPARETTNGPAEERTPPEPSRLTSAQLIAQGDAICRKAQEAFKATREEFPEAKLEETADVPYSEELVANSSQAISEFKKLVPPKDEEAIWNEYLASQEEVAKFDRRALAAAEADDLERYLQERENRNETEDNRTRMAEAIGFHDCSGSDA